MDEMQLVRRARAGDQECFAQLFQRYVREAVRAAYLITRNWDLAEDAVQEAFIRAYGALRTFDPARPFRPWLYRLVTNEALRALERHRRLVPVDPLPEPAAEPPAADQAGGWEDRQQIRAAVMQLSEPQRVAVVLKYFLGFKEAELAAMLGVPVSTVKSRLFDARRTLERLLTVEAGD